MKQMDQRLVIQGGHNFTSQVLRIHFFTALCVVFEPSWQKEILHETDSVIDLLSLILSHCIDFSYVFFLKEELKEKELFKGPEVNFFRL